MKGEFFLRAVGGIDVSLIAEADTAVTTVRRIPGWVRPAGMAAACALLVSAVVLALPILWRTASDSAAPEATQDTWNPLADEEIGAASNGKTDVDYSGAGTPAETGTVLETTMHPVTDRTFWFCEGDVWRTEVRMYPDGLPSTETLVNDYLEAADSEVRCTAVSHTVTGEKDEVLGDIVVHTVGVTTWTVTLDGDPGEDVCRGLVNTVLNSRVSSSLYQVEIHTPTRDYPACGAYEY